jgi:hypothetical protein
MVTGSLGHMTRESGRPGRVSRATELVRYPAVWKVSPNRLEVPNNSGQKTYLVAPDGLSLLASSHTFRVVPRRDLRDHLQKAVGYPDRCLVEYLDCSEVNLHWCGRRSKKWCRFSLQFSGFGVERGRLGKVVSLVGDCRPPPPGNPHRPSDSICTHDGLEGRRVRTARAVIGGFCFTPRNPKYGVVLSSGWTHHSFNKYQITSNLKELNNPQYFKNNRSYSSCVGRKPVLEFVHLHSHLCGQMEVEPPPIAITNVLEIR